MKVGLRRGLWLSPWFVLLLLHASAWANRVTSSVSDAYPIIGWHWYNELPPATIRKHRPVNHQAFARLTPLQQLAVLQAVTRQRRAKAILSGRVTDIAAYKQAQDFWVRRATAFTVGWERMQLRYPLLDYSLNHPHENWLAPFMQNRRHRAEDQAIHQLSQHAGLWLFYRASMAVDQRFLVIVKRFAARYHLALLSVAEGDALSQEASHSARDLGQVKARALGITHFPALLLVNPQQQRYQVVSYGGHAESVLAHRLWQLAHHWQAGF